MTISHPWLVVLIKQPSLPLPLSFPRKFLTKEHALAVIDTIRKLGGEAELSSTEFWTGEEPASSSYRH